MEYYFDTDDKLDRRKYAEFLKSMLENCDKYRRDDSDGAYVIAIDSPWGTGKTRFAKMLRNYLEDRTKEMGDESLPGKNASFNAIYYNSWETDFSDDALLPLVHSILESPEMDEKRFDTEGEEMLKKFKKAAIDVARIAGYTILHNICGETVTLMAKAAETAATEVGSDPLKSYKDRLSVLNKFKIDLQDVIAQTRQKKLVIIIDELDRCRPTFAIQTLEHVKHLFSVRGLIFIFALDIRQLSSSVKTIYGLDMDAPGYLCRFFNYIGRMPSSGYNKYISSKLNTLLPVDRTKSAISISRFVKRTFFNLKKAFDLSLRDTDTLMSTYNLIYNVYLNKYNDVNAHGLYLFLICLKYKKPYYFDSLLNGNLDLKDIKVPLFEEIYEGEGKYTLTDRRLKRFNEQIPVNGMKWSTYSTNSGMVVEERIFNSFDNEKLETENELTYTLAGIGEAKKLTYSFDSQQNLGQLLFFEDLKKWHKIKSNTLGQYYHQQLEMFNFALPADDTETKL